MPEKLKELLDNPWFKGFLILLLAAFLLGHARRCSRTVKPIPTGDNAKWSKLMLVIDQIEKNYVDTISYKEIIEKAIPSLLESLDPHSVYLPPTDLQRADESLIGNFSGIGIEFNVPNDTAVVVSVIPGGPSSRAGLHSGDRIIKVDERTVAGVSLPQDSLIRLLRGPRDTKVTVEIQRNGVNELIPFEITRGVIPINSLDAALMITPTLGYIKLSTFSLTTHLEFLKAALELKAQGMKTLLLDLRDNPGGFMEQAVLISNEFLKKGDKVVYMQGRMRKREDFKARGTGRLKDVKLYVAINESSASSSEIVAGAIQDNDRGTIIGRRSFGKGLVQEPIRFSDSSGIRLTVARFYTPSGRCIQKPYTPDYNYDILGRYQRGEMRSADSIKVNDSLKYTTVGGRTVYGGGGIMPDVFVPIDTVGVTDFLIKVNRKSLLMKFSSHFADLNRAALDTAKSLEDLEVIFNSEHLQNQFLLYAASEGIRPKGYEWEQSGFIVIQQLKGLIGRYSAMKEDAVYPYVLKIDNLVDKVKELEGEADTEKPEVKTVLTEK